ncbi:Pentatricopeptide repeat-containing protein [Corchorus olitorius]|uniref:Pentatricopeptide repeat-containing protein n=1 Tax=Corchorus olitorius TaxID=93759 RepID=A0A1R3K694_9ROSI|nr:Pentatricopeptide repeat-containing protein [Corchorus olitorius]
MCHQVFDEIPEKDVVSWTVLITRYFFGLLGERLIVLIVNNIGARLSPIAHKVGSCFIFLTL